MNRSSPPPCDINIHIPDDLLPSTQSSSHKVNNDNEDHHIGGGRGGSVDSGLARNVSLLSELDKYQPMKSEQLFKDRPSFAEQDICFPSPSCISSTTSPRSSCPSYPSHSGTKQHYQLHRHPQQQEQQQQKQQGIQHTQFDRDALQLFRSYQAEPEKVVSGDAEKRLSLYGDSHALVMLEDTQPVQDDTPRFVYYHSDTGRLHGKTLFDLINGSDHPGVTIDDLLNKENHWLDITSPSQSEMHAISRIFGIHPLTTEDIINQEIREKCDSFRNYLFVCYRAFVHDDHVLKPISFYNVVFKQHLLTIHFGKVPHVDFVQRRVEQLQAYITVVPDWINYAIVDEVTDSFAPLIHQIEHEVESLDDVVLHSLNSTSIDQTEMVSRIGFCRKRVMQMLRLLSSKSDVIRALVKRFEERSTSSSPLSRDQFAHQQNYSQSPQQQQQQQQQQQHIISDNIASIIDTIHTAPRNPDGGGGSISSNTTVKASPLTNTLIPPATLHQDIFDSCNLQHTRKGSYSYTTSCTGFEGDGRILPDVGLYLGDVQDHIVTMLQNLNHYETLLARTHTNYLAKISIELTHTSNSTNLVIGRLTIFATILLPMNLITGIWGMNVKVPGGDFDNLAYFFWIVCSLAAFAVFALTLARKWELF